MRNTFSTNARGNGNESFPVNNPLNKERRKKMAQHTKKKRYEPRRDLAEFRGIFLTLHGECRNYEEIYDLVENGTQETRQTNIFIIH